MSSTNTLFLQIHGGRWHSNTDHAWAWLSFLYPLPAAYLTREKGLWTLPIQYPLAMVPSHYRYQYMTFFGLAVSLAVATPYWLFSGFMSSLAATIARWTLIAGVAIYLIAIWFSEFYGTPVQRWAPKKSRIVDDKSSRPIYRDQLDEVDRQIRQACTEYPHKRIVVFGHDAGAHLLALWALRQKKYGDLPKSIIALVTSDGIYDLEDYAVGPQNYSDLYQRRVVLEPAFGPQGSVWRSASPMHVGGREGPVVPRDLDWYVCSDLFGNSVKEAQARSFQQRIARYAHAQNAGTNVHFEAQLGMANPTSRQFVNLLKQICKK